MQPTLCLLAALCAAGLCSSLSLSAAPPTKPATTTTTTTTTRAVAAKADVATLTRQLSEKAAETLPQEQVEQSGQLRRQKVLHVATDALAVAVPVALPAVNPIVARFVANKLHKRINKIGRKRPRDEPEGADEDEPAAEEAASRRTKGKAEAAEARR